MLCFFVYHFCLFAVVCRFTKSSMLFRLETSLVWFCLSFICVLAGPLNVTPRNFRRRYSPDSAATSAAVNSTSVARASSVCGIDQQADSQPTPTLSSLGSYTTTPHSSVPGAINFETECILWDQRCTGNETAALEAFFNQDGDRWKEDGAMWQLVDNNCFAEYFLYSDDVSSIAAGVPLPTGSTVGQLGWSTESNGGTPLPPVSSSFGSSMLRWMREPECLSSYNTYKFLHAPHIPPHTRNNSGWGDEICCGPCEPKVLNVNIYYWPIPGTDTSCQSIIGTGLEQLRDDATTDAQGTVYWGYPLSSTDSDDRSVIYTAILSTMNGVTFKMPLVNP